MTLADLGWTLKAHYHPGINLYAGLWWHDTKGVPRFHENSYVARVVDGRVKP